MITALEAAQLSSESITVGIEAIMTDLELAVTRAASRGERRAVVVFEKQIGEEVLRKTKSRVEALGYHVVASAKKIEVSW